MAATDLRSPWHGLLATLLVRAGTVRQVLPIALEVTTPSLHYVRVHRRHGTTNRLLPQAEIDAWAMRIVQHLAPRLQGPIYFLWGEGGEALRHGSKPRQPRVSDLPSYGQVDCSFRSHRCCQSMRCAGTDHEDVPMRNARSALLSDHSKHSMGGVLCSVGSLA